MQYTVTEAQDWLIISFLRGGAACGASSGYLQAQSGLKVIDVFEK